MRCHLLVVALAIAGCGGGGKEEQTTPEAPTGIKSAPTGATPTVTPEIDAFHAAFAPKWHAVGSSRMQVVCGAIPDLQTKFAAVKKAGAPSDLDESAWKSASGRIDKTLDGVKKTCGGSDKRVFETAFTELHYAFHDYMDLVVGEHGHGQGDGRGGKEGILRDRAPEPTPAAPATSTSSN
jgi:hypothetical protein